MINNHIRGQMSKRQMAAACRMAARSIEQYGWIRNAYGDQKGGFCAVGALAFALKSESNANAPHFVSAGTFRKCAGHKALKAVKDALQAEIVYVDEPGNEWGGKYVSTGRKLVDLPSWNDNVATADEVITFFRKLAKHLEHGGDL